MEGINRKTITGFVKVPQGLAENAAVMALCMTYGHLTPVDIKV